MKTLSAFVVWALVLLGGGCGLSPTKVRARVVEHKQQGGGNYYALLYEVLSPKNLAGRYGVAATQRSDLVTNVDGGEFEIYLNFTMVGTLGNKPLDFGTSPPSSKEGDFLEMAKRLK